MLLCFSMYNVITFLTTPYVGLKYLGVFSCTCLSQQRTRILTKLWSKSIDTHVSVTVIATQKKEFLNNIFFAQQNFIIFFVHKLSFFSICNIQGIPCIIHLTKIENLRPNNWQSAKLTWYCANFFSIMLILKTLQ